jgi:hypothetical protein
MRVRETCRGSSRADVPWKIRTLSRPERKLFSLACVGLGVVGRDGSGLAGVALSASFSARKLH